MFGEFTFDQTEVKSRHVSGLEPSISPRDVPADWDSPHAAPATPGRPTLDSRDSLNRRGSESIDSLILQMSRQTLLPYVRSSGCVRAVRRAPDTATEWSIPPNPSIPLPFVRVQQSQSLTLDQRAPGAQLQAQDAEPIALPNVAGEFVIDHTFRQTQERLRASVQTAPINPRTIRETLMEMMITQGVQCSIQPSSPLTPASVSEPTTPSMRACEPEHATDQSMANADDPLEPLEALEVDSVFNEKDEGSFLRNMVSLRQAGAPCGIRRPSALRFCSSAEKAMKGRNLKRNKIKMRKRDAKPPLSPTQMLTPPPEEVASPASS